jgi:hypothetical protein
VNSARPDQAFVQAIAMLARAAPQEWGQFLNQFENYGKQQAMACVQSPPLELNRMQGRAQQCASLQDLFSHAVKTADRMAQKTAASEAAHQRR